MHIEDRFSTAWLRQDIAHLTIQVYPELAQGLVLILLKCQNTVSFSCSASVPTKNFTTFHSQVRNMCSQAAFVLVSGITEASAALSCK